MTSDELSEQVRSNREWLAYLRSTRAGAPDTPDMAEFSAAMDAIEEPNKTGDRRAKRASISAVLMLVIFFAIVFLRASGRL